MPNEQERAERSIARGKQAARMMKSGQSMEKVRGYVSAQGEGEAKARRINATIGKLAGYSTDPIGSFKKGGKVRKTGRYKVHKGETVMSKSHPCLDC